MTVPWTALGIPRWAVATIMACVILVGFGIKIGMTLQDIRIEQKYMRWDLCRLMVHSGLDTPYSCSYTTPSGTLEAQEMPHDPGQAAARR